MRLAKHKHDLYLRACTDPRATEEERAHLSYCASMAAAGESVTRAEYVHAEAIIGGIQRPDVVPLHKRPMPA